MYHRYSFFEGVERPFILTLHLPPSLPPSGLQVQGPCLTWSWSFMWLLHNRVLRVLIGCWLSWCVYELDGNTKGFVCIYFVRNASLSLLMLVISKESFASKCCCSCFPGLKPEGHICLDDSQDSHCMQDALDVLLPLQRVAFVLGNFQKKFGLCFFPQHQSPLHTSGCSS